MNKKNAKPDEQTKKNASKPVEAGKTKDIQAKLEHLRSIIKEISRVLVANWERDILELIELINSLNSVKKRAGKIKAAELEKVEALLSKLSVKPAKGRRSDLKKIEKILEEMKEILGRGQNG